jgi:hypothetical protein
MGKDRRSEGRGQRSEVRGQGRFVEKMNIEQRRMIEKKHEHNA